MAFLASSFIFYLCSYNYSANDNGFYYYYYWLGVEIVGFLIAWLFIWGGGRGGKFKAVFGGGGILWFRFGGKGIVLWPGGGGKIFVVYCYGY